jgi:tungstate transport system substrate-binding protein
MYEHSAAWSSSIHRTARQLRRLAPALAVCAVLVACGNSAPVVRLATTTSVENSGLLAAILPSFEREHGVEVEVLPVGSGRALELLRRGDAVAALTHDPVAEASALAAGVIAGYRKIMFNDFLVVGPASDPAGIRDASDAADALRRIATGAALFASRGDASGTHSREQELWRLAGTKPDAEQLLETGQGMAATLRIASERMAYTLTDRATYEQFQSDLRLVALHEGGPALLNTYAVFVRADLTGAGRERADALVDWLADGTGRDLIAGFRVAGRPVFTVWPPMMPRERPSDLPVIDVANAR